MLSQFTELSYDQLVVLSTALSQFIENSKCEGAERREYETALAMLDDVDHEMVERVS